MRMLLVTHHTEEPTPVALFEIGTGGADKGRLTAVIDALDGPVRECFEGWVGLSLTDVANRPAEFQLSAHGVPDSVARLPSAPSNGSVPNH